MTKILCTGSIAKHISVISKLSQQVEFMKKPWWTKEEVELLKQNYTAPITELAKMIPSRTEYAIATKSNRLGLLKQLSSRNINGTFKRIRKPFSLENFNDGYVDNKGRFRVYLPQHPKAYGEGYILREIAAYEAYHDVQVPKDMCIHHIDGNRLNDSEENLEMMPFGAHTTFHKTQPEARVERICKNCGKIFLIERWRLKDSSRGTYCSQNCYKEYKKLHMKTAEEQKARIQAYIKEKCKDPNFREYKRLYQLEWRHTHKDRVKEYNRKKRSKEGGIAN